MITLQPRVGEFRIENISGCVLAKQQKAAEWDQLPLRYYKMRRAELITEAVRWKY